VKMTTLRPAPVGMGVVVVVLVEGYEGALGPKTFRRWGLRILSTMTMVEVQERA